MLAGAITLVLMKRKLRVLSAIARQNRVTGDFSQDGCGADRLNQAVAVHDGFGRDVSSGKRLPSTSTCPGNIAKPVTARRMASKLACRMFIWSISTTLASAIQ